MGLKEIWAGFVHAVDTEYDRRIRAASNVRAYQIGGHGHHHDHGDHTEAEQPEEQLGDSHVAFGTGTTPADVEPQVPSSH